MPRYRYDRAQIIADLEARGDELSIAAARLLRQDAEVKDG